MRVTLGKGHEACVGKICKVHESKGCEPHLVRDVRRIGQGMKGTCG